MDFDEDRFKPDSNKKLLYQQFLEQSDVCDVTVRIGNWQKKFHWCVLVMSPFFESLRRNNFLEKQTGIMQLDISTPLVIEMAISFLYGRKPKITDTNVSGLLEISEFLLVPNLKCSCVKFLKQLSISDENCMKMLELSSLYELDLPKVEDYIIRHVPDILQKDEAVKLTKQSIIELFEDPLLSYVSSEDKFTFLVRWAKECDMNESMFSEIFNVIDFENIDLDFFETTVRNNLQVAQLSSTKSLPHPAVSDMHKVLVFPDMKKEDRLACFDLNKKTWCGINVGLGEDSEISRKFRYSSIAAVRGKQYADIYRMKNNYESCSVLRQPLGTGHVTEFTVSKSDTGSNKLEGFDHCVIIGETFFAVSNFTSKVERKNNPYKPRIRELKYGLLILQRNETSIHTDYATIYQGTLQHPDTQIAPLLTIRNATVEQLCVKASGTAAFLTNDRKKLYIYDINNCTLDTIRLDEHTKRTNRYVYGNSYILAATDDGFLLYNKKESVCISRLNSPSLPERFAIQTVDLENQLLWTNVEYYFCADTWIRFLHKSLNEDHEFACVSHKTLLTKEDGQEIPWTPLPITKELGRMRRDKHVFMISLPRSSVGCHFNCPHCEQLKSNDRRNVASYLVSESDCDNFYEDSDSDDSDSDDYGEYYYPGYYYDDYGSD